MSANVTMKNILLLLLTSIICFQVTSSTSDEMISRFTYQSYSDHTKRALLTNGGWMEGSPPYLPHNLACAHVGQINNIIVMIGNCYSINTRIGMAVVAYDIDTNSFVQYDDIPRAQLAYGQAYTQIANSLYMLDSSVVRGEPFVINVYKLDTKEFIYNYKVIPHSADAEDCLSQINDNYLIIAGEGPKNVQIYSISQDIWLDNVPLMKQERHRPACITYHDENNHFVYVFSGSRLLSIEKLDVSDMMNVDQAEWIELNDKLTGTGDREASRAVIYGTNIYIIGGKPEFHEFSQTDKVDVLDTTTDSVTMFDSLIYVTFYTAAIVVNDKMYAFGGGPIPWQSEFESKQWQFYDFGPTMEVSKCFIGSICRKTDDCCPDGIDEHVNGVRCKKKKVKSKDEKKKEKLCCIKQGFSGCESNDHCCSGKKLICSEEGICIKNKNKNDGQSSDDSQSHDGQSSDEETRSYRAGIEQRIQDLNDPINLQYKMDSKPSNYSQTIYLFVGSFWILLIGFIALFSFLFWIYRDKHLQEEIAFVDEQKTANI